MNYGFNLIAWNPLPEFPYKKPEARRVEWFQQRIRQAGIPVTTRISRGSAVCGACGQLGPTTPSEWPTGLTDLAKPC